MTKHDAVKDEVNQLRRALIFAAGAAGAELSGGVARAQSAASHPSGASYIDLSCKVSAAQLDAQVAKAFSAFNRPVILPAFNAKTHGALNDVELHRIVTHTVSPETGERLKVSGLLALPAGAKGELPLVSWQHGTILSFDQVPSNLTKLSDPDYELTDEADSLETLFNVQRFAGRGFAVVAADYVGKGPFREEHGEAYVVKGTTVQTCLDILAAGQAAMGSLGVKPSKLFLNGWSQGALNTLWLHQALRKQSRPITATAVASAFSDLSEAWSYWGGALTFPLPQGVSSYPQLASWIPLCMILALGSYERQYGMKGLLENAVRPEFREFAVKYWKDYKLETNQLSQLPTSKTLLVPGFYEHATSPVNSAFLRQFAANDACFWKYDSPIRFHYGLADEAVHPAMVYRALAAGGMMTQGVKVAGGSHRGTFLASLYGTGSSLAGFANAVAWFRSYS
ncbi:alpha/beta hydrolase family protein [Acidocella aminolytica]|jgi:acetyl esterase/lipase|uniref:Peptidase S9 prolyl oligopeptidase catalytic domain-containing protein n=1 Tax=Acidocella aminolytica 101 = DSM 11237 TaxID=1120923 RepID=A0A0D6PGW9_9PROT|nr:prolyl oligopeptidase family serine peptidase [Acidocella aminolytica]GAN80453.1 hypothetical protein Aam_047_034 [Acidocella aminolytica 101 = DSM 11237]GBQ35825.1 hypothetical protein AA11237_1068 [Acidocella aminolytica 101 = DSM 11237]SHE96167.1 Prolyl oligopeptidase family protein [Acidocella aminolytica 101 = DSM 11237]